MRKFACGNVRVSEKVV